MDLHKMTEENSIARLQAVAKLSPITKENYILRVKRYLKRVNMTPDRFVREVSRKPKWFEEDFIKFIGEVSKTSASSTVAFWRDSLRRFLEINRVKGVDWDYINQFLPKVVKSGQDRAPTLEEIRKLVSVADIRTKCLILFLCSSGSRIGAIDYLHWKDIQEVEFEGRKLAKMVGYRGEPEEYLTFVTPECYEYLLRYREFREALGEKINPPSPVFIQEINKRNFDQKKVKPVSVGTLKNQLGELLNQMGMRSTLVEKENYRSYEFKQAHGFRKFFKTRMEMSGVKPIVTELLMQHDVGVQASCMKPTHEELLAEYAKAIENLTILGAKQTVSEQTVLTTIRKEMLSARYNEEEINQFGELSKLTTEKFVEILNRKAQGLNGNGNQRVVPISEIKGMVEQGWEYVSQLPDGYAVIKLPRP